ncbi:hypothetical protein [Enterococcus sp. AZ192]
MTISFKRTVLTQSNHPGEWEKAGWEQLLFVNDWLTNVCDDLKK